MFLYRPYCGRKFNDGKVNKSRYVNVCKVNTNALHVRVRRPVAAIKCII